MTSQRERIERLIDEYGVACYAYSGEELESTRYAALMTAIDSLIGDAARYRWLRDEGSEWDKTGIVAFDGYDGIGHAFDDALDAAIDAAIAASGVK